MSAVKYFTQEGLNKLKLELEKMKTVERPSISQQIAEAREKGDLSEMPNMMLQKMPKECSNFVLLNSKMFLAMPE